MTEFHLSCAGEDTRYFMGAASGQISGNLILHCDGATGPTTCTFSYKYPKDNPNDVGGGSGPTCTP
jgi:hypothetical protein